MNNVLARAQKLMLDPGFNQAVEAKANSYAGRRGGIGNSANDLRMFEAQAFGTPIQNTDIEYLTEQVPQRDPSKSKLPKNVVESFRNQAPMSGDGLMAPQPTAYYAPQGNVVPQAYIPQNQAIDYNYIKHLVSEAIKETMSGVLNESTMKGMRIANGNVVQVLAKNGDLYEGVLKLKKKANA